jgi:outer membrane protein TolC
LNVPIYSGGQVSATARQASARLEQAKYLAEDIRQNINVRMGREFDNVVQGIAKIRALERAEASGQQSVRSAKKGVQAGVRSTLDVLQIEQQYYTTLRDLAQARYAYLIACLRMKSLAGVLKEEDVEHIDASLVTVQ